MNDRTFAFLTDPISLKLLQVPSVDRAVVRNGDQHLTVHTETDLANWLRAFRMCQGDAPGWFWVGKKERNSLGTHKKDHTNSNDCSNHNSYNENSLRFSRVLFVDSPHVDHADLIADRQEALSLVHRKSNEPDLVVFALELVQNGRRLIGRVVLGQFDVVHVLQFARLPEYDGVLAGFGEDQIAVPANRIDVVAMDATRGEDRKRDLRRLERLLVAIAIVFTRVQNRLPHFVRVQSPDLQRVIHADADHPLRAQVKFGTEHLVAMSFDSAENRHACLGLDVPQPHRVILADREQQVRIFGMRFELINRIAVSLQLLDAFHLQNVQNANDAVGTADDQQMICCLLLTVRHERPAAAVVVLLRTAVLVGLSQQYGAVRFALVDRRPVLADRRKDVLIDLLQVRVHLNAVENGLAVVLSVRMLILLLLDHRLEHVAESFRIAFRLVRAGGQSFYVNFHHFSDRWLALNDEDALVEVPCSGVSDQIDEMC